MRMNEMFGGDFLKSEDFKGRDVTLTIAGIKMESIGGDGEKPKEKPVMTFRETDKRLVLNKTNAGVLAKFYGDDTNGWIAQKVTLFVQQVQFRGKWQDGIRVRAGANGAEKLAAAPTAPQVTDEIPF